jgi:dTMP kinase
VTFVVLEGGDAVGKSTQLALLASRLRATFPGREVVVTFEPGATKLGEVVRGLFLGRSAGPLAPRTEALLIAADRAEHVATVVRPALARGAIVVSDRYVPSSLAYQGSGTGLPVDEILALSAWATDSLAPDEVIVLDAPPSVLAARRPFEESDRIEAESSDFHDRVRAAYRSLAERFGWTLIDASGTVEAVHEAIWEAVREVLEPEQEP